MRYVRATLHPDTHEILSVQEQGSPFTAPPIKFDDIEHITIDVGAFDDADLPEAGRARYIHERIEIVDGKARVRDDVDDLPQPLETPTTLEGLREHLDTLGRNHSLPEPVARDLRIAWWGRQDTKLMHLKHLGMSIDAIKSVPKIEAGKRARTEARAAALAEQLEAQREAVRQARIARKLTGG